MPTGERLAYVAGDVALWPGLTGGQCLDILGATQGGLDEARRAALIDGVTLDALDRTAYAAVAITSNALADVVGTELTFLGWRTLVILGESTGSLRLTDLAEHLRLSRPSASKLVRRLEHRGFVSLAPNPADGRGLLISLAAEGARVRTAVTQRRREILAGALAEPVPPAFGDGLAVIANRLERWIWACLLSGQIEHRSAAGFGLPHICGSGSSSAR